MKIHKFDLLVALYIFCIIVSELMGAKTIPLLSIGGFQLNGSVALLVVPILFTINDVVVEVYGRERARSIVYSGLLVVALLVVMTFVATSLPPSARFMSSEAAYDEIFGKSIRMALASLAAFALAEVLDVWVFSKLREKLGEKGLWLRNNVSNILAQGADTVIFMTLAFYALDVSLGENSVFLLSLIIPYWLLKCAVSALETPLVYLGVAWLRKREAANLLK